MTNINVLFEQANTELAYINEFNEALSFLPERKRSLCTIRNTDSKSLRRRKCNVARRWGIHHVPLWAMYNTPVAQPDTASDSEGGDGGEGGASVSEVKSTEKNLPPLQFIPPDPAIEWDEAAGYEEFKSRDKKAWVDALENGKPELWSSLSNVGNFEPDLAKIDKDKIERVGAYVSIGVIELPVVGKWEDGSMEVISGATRLAVLKQLGYDPFVLVISVPAKKEKKAPERKRAPRKKAPAKRKKPSKPKKEKGKEPPKSSTERVRRYYKRHPEKVRKYLRKTQDDRVARNRDRRKAVKKYGKKKMKNHDVHHPNGAKNGNWRLARKDHGRDKLNELYLPSVDAQYEYLLHPKTDKDIRFSDIKEFIAFGVGHGIDTTLHAPNPIDDPRYIVVTEDMLERANSCVRKLTERLAKIHTTAGTPEEATISEYMKSRWLRLMEGCPVMLSPDDKQILVDRWVDKKKKTSVAQVSSPEAVSWALRVDELVPMYEYKFLYPINKLISELVLESVKRSLDYLAHKNNGLSRIFKKKLIDEISKMKSDTLADNIQKTNDCIRILETMGLEGIVPKDGLVLTHKGILYKYTGPFTSLERVGGNLESYIPVEQKVKKPTIIRKVLTLKEREAAKTALQQMIVNPETNNPISLGAALKYDRTHPAHAVASRMLRSSILQEAVSAPVEETGAILNEFSEPTSQLVIQTLGMGTVKTQLVGSIDQPVSNDIDVAVDIESMKKFVGYGGTDIDELMSMIEATLSSIDSNIIYSTKYKKFTAIAPIVNAEKIHQPQFDENGDVIDEKGYVRVDFMLGNLEWMRQYLVNGDESQYPPIYRNVLLESLTESVKFDTEQQNVQVQYKISTRAGLYKKTIETAEDGTTVVSDPEFVSIDTDELAASLFGGMTPFSEIDTYEKLIEKLMGEKSPLEPVLDHVFDTYSKKLASLGLEPPEGASAKSRDESPKTPIAIFPGKFQPYHAGHHEIYEELVRKFGKGNVYIAITEKADPYKLDQRLKLMTDIFGIPEENIIVVKDLTNPTELTSQFPPQTPIVFAVTERDAEKFDQSYFKPFATDTKLVGQDAGAYILKIPPIAMTIGDKKLTATQLNSILGSPKVTDRAKQELFARAYGKVDSTLLTKMVKNAMTKEEEKELERMYAAPKQPSAPAEDEERGRRVAAQDDLKEPVDRELYDVGEVWNVPTSGMFGAKNAKGKIAYFKTQEAALEFSRT